MAAIDVGAAAIDRALNWPAGWTAIDEANPANLTGKITSVEIWAETNLVGCKVATFEKVNGNSFTTRSTYAIGNVTAGSKQTKVVDLDVVAGDYIGVYFTAGEIDLDNSGGSGNWYANADHIPCASQAFSHVVSYAMSLYGIGTDVTGWSGKVSGVTNPAKVSGVAKANIGKVIGVS